MFPFRDHNPSERTPYVTWALIAINIAVFISYFGLFQNERMLARFFFEWGLVPAYATPANFVTSMFLHGSIMHIGFNMYALYILGRQLEPFYGPWRFLLLYLAGGFSGVVASYLLTVNPSLGASTATFGLLAAYGIFGLKNQKIFGERSRMIVRNAVQVIVINLLLGLSPGIDNWGHLGGALGGLALAWFGGPVLGAERKEMAIHIRDTRSPQMFAAAFLGVIVVSGALVVFSL